MKNTIRVQSFPGKEAEPHLEDLARLRIEVFREFPYLYDGAMEYEQTYIQTYMDTSNSILILAFDGEEVIGASTGIPIEQEADNIKAPWLEKGFDLSQIFYYGESVLKKAYRGQGIGSAFFREREAWVQILDRFKLITFCAVVRPDNHPRRPADYVPHHAFWKKEGFQPTQNLTCEISWQDLDEDAESPKSLLFWYKLKALAIDQDLREQVALL